MELINSEMQNAEVVSKFGNEYKVNNDTYIMGVHRLFADHIASRFSDCKTVLDACCGAGFMAIALAKVADKVIAVDINADHLSQARTNAKMAGVLDKIEFINADVSDPETIGTLGDIDGAFLDPDWAKSGDEKTFHVHKLSEMQPDGNLLMDLVRQKTNNIALRLPKEIDERELQKYKDYQVEDYVMNGKLKFFTVYFGSLAKTFEHSKFSVE